MEKTPSLNDILTELEPLGYKETWRIIESLKAKGFEDVEETIDKFVREGKLKKIGKYILATKDTWKEYQRKIAEELEKKPKEEKPPTEPYDFILEKLKSAFLAEIELAGYNPEDLDLSNVMKQIIELAKEIHEGRKEQIEAMKEIILKARELIRKIEDIKARFSDLVKEGDKIVKTYDKMRVEIISAEELTEGEAKKKKSELDAIVKRLKAIVKELKGLYETAPLKDIKDRIEEYENIIEETKKLKKEIDEKVIKLPKHVREILDKLKTTFVAQLELAGFSKKDIEDEWGKIQPEIEKLADKVAKGEMSVAEAVKEVIRKAKVIAKPEEVTPPEELKVVKEEIPSRVKGVKEIWKERETEYIPAPETIEMAMHIKDIMTSLGWKGAVELLKPHLPEIFAYGIEDFLKRHREWSLAIPPTKENVEAIFRNLRRSIEQQALEKYNRGELSFREWLIGGAPEEIRLPLLAMLLYYGYTSDAFKKELEKVYENPKIQNALKKYGITSFDEFYKAMVEFLRQYRL